MNKSIQAIIEKPMNRKEFLGYIGVAILGVIGVTGMLKSLAHHNGVSSSNIVSDGYGSTNYGGIKK